MRLALLLLAVAALQCTPPPATADAPPLATPEPHAAVEPPEVAVVGDRLLVVFRTPEPVALSATAPARLATPDGTVVAEPVGPPSVTREGDVSVVSAAYALATGEAVMANRSGSSSTLELEIGGERYRFPVVRSDVLE